MLLSQPLQPSLKNNSEMCTPKVAFKKCCLCFDDCPCETFRNETIFVRHRGLVKCYYYVLLCLPVKIRINVWN